MERKLISEADSRPLVVIDPRGAAVARRARRRRPRRRLAGRALRAQDRLLAADARRPPRVGDRARPAGLARAARPARAARRARRPVAGRRAEPPRAGRSTSPPAPSTARRAGSAARPAAASSSCPGAMADRRAMLEVAGCYGYVSGPPERRGRRRRAGGRGVIARRAQARRVDARAAVARVGRRRRGAPLARGRASRRGAAAR